MAAATENPDSLKARLGTLFVSLIQPHTLVFKLTLAAAVGIITAIFGTIILLMIMVAANFNPLGFIE